MVDPLRIYGRKGSPRRGCTLLRILLLFLSLFETSRIFSLILRLPYSEYVNAYSNMFFVPEIDTFVPEGLFFEFIVLKCFMILWGYFRRTLNVITVVYADGNAHDVKAITAKALSGESKVKTLVVSKNEKNAPNAKVKIIKKKYSS